MRGFDATCDLVDKCEGEKAREARGDAAKARAGLVSEAPQPFKARVGNEARGAMDAAGEKVEAAAGAHDEAHAEPRELLFVLAKPKLLLGRAEACDQDGWAGGGEVLEDLRGDLWGDVGTRFEGRREALQFEVR